MPRPTKWYARIEPALGVLRKESSPLLSRRYIESLLGVSGRQANRFTKDVGYAPCDPPQKLFVERTRVIRELEKILGKPEYQEFEERRIQVAHKLELKRRHEIASKAKVKIDHRLLGATLGSLPESIRIERGKVILEAEETEEMLGLLLVLGQALGNDIERFRTVLEGK